VQKESVKHVSLESIVSDGVFATYVKECDYFCKFQGHQRIAKASTCRPEACFDDKSERKYCSNQTEPIISKKSYPLLYSTIEAQSHCSAGHDEERYRYANVDGTKVTDCGQHDEEIAEELLCFQFPALCHRPHRQTPESSGANLTK